MEVLNCYAPGDGTLAFVWLKDGKAEGRPVTRQDVDEYMRSDKGRTHTDRQIIKVNNQYRLVADIKRVGTYTLTLNGERYYYSGHGFSTDDCPLVKNISTIAALRFFLNNEKHYNNPDETLHKIAKLFVGVHPDNVNDPYGAEVLTVLINANVLTTDPSGRLTLK